MRLIVESFDIINDSVTFFKLMLFGLKMSKLIFEKFRLFSPVDFESKENFWQVCNLTEMSVNRWKGVP